MYLQTKHLIARHRFWILRHIENMIIQSHASSGHVRVLPRYLQRQLVEQSGLMKVMIIMAKLVTERHPPPYPNDQLKLCSCCHSALFFQSHNICKHRRSQPALLVYKELATCQEWDLDLAWHQIFLFNPCWPHWLLNIDDRRTQPAEDSRGQMGWLTEHVLLSILI